MPMKIEKKIKTDNIKTIVQTTARMFSQFRDIKGQYIREKDIRQLV